MRAFDTSSIVHAWDNYPIEQFPILWEWLGRQVTAREIVLPSVAFEEVGHVSPDCGAWLVANELQQLPMTEGILLFALAIKEVLGIGNQYGIGVGENDLFIVSAAAINGCGLVSNEAVQPALPLAMSKYKMPAVCAMPIVGVNCVSFIDYLKQSGVVFG